MCKRVVKSERLLDNMLVIESFNNRVHNCVPDNLCFCPFELIVTSIDIRHRALLECQKLCDDVMVLYGQSFDYLITICLEMLDRLMHEHRFDVFNLRLVRLLQSFNEDLLLLYLLNEVNVTHTSIELDVDSTLLCLISKLRPHLGPLTAHLSEGRMTHNVRLST